MIEIEYYKLLDELKTNKYTSYTDFAEIIYYTNGEKYYIQYPFGGPLYSYNEQEFMVSIPKEAQEKLFKAKFENEVNK